MMPSADWSGILDLFDTEQRRDIVYLDAVREVTPDVVRHTSRVGGRGFILHWKLAEADVERVAREQIAHFSSLGQDFEWKVYGHDLPPGLGERLAALGFQPEPEETLVCLDLAAMPARLASLNVAQVERVTDPNGVDDIFAVENTLWSDGRTDLADSLKMQLRDDSDHFGLYLVRKEGKVASVGWARFDENSSFASLWGGTTAPAWRNQGLYSALVAARAAEAIRQRYKYATVDALPTSQPILEKLGFKALTRVRGYVWEYKKLMV